MADEFTLVCEIYFQVSSRWRTCWNISIVSYGQVFQINHVFSVCYILCTWKKKQASRCYHTLFFNLCIYFIKKLLIKKQNRYWPPPYCPLSTTPPRLWCDAENINIIIIISSYQITVYMSVRARSCFRQHLTVQKSRENAAWPCLREAFHGRRITISCSGRGCCCGGKLCFFLGWPRRIIIFAC